MSSFKMAIFGVLTILLVTVVSVYGYFTRNLNLTNGISAGIIAAYVVYGISVVTEKLVKSGSFTNKIILSALLIIVMLLFLLLQEKVFVLISSAVVGAWIFYCITLLRTSKST